MPRRVTKEIEMVYTRACCWGIQGDINEQECSFPLRLTLEPPAWLPGLITT